MQFHGKLMVKDISFGRRQILTFPQLMFSTAVSRKNMYTLSPYDNECTKSGSEKNDQLALFVSNKFRKKHNWFIFLFANTVPSNMLIC